MPYITLSSKNQVTIPVRLLDGAGIHAKDRLEIREEAGVIQIRKIKSIFEHEGTVKGRGLSIEEEKRMMIKGVAEHVSGRRR